MSHVDRDKISLSEIKGHLADHAPVKENWRLHWLYPGLPLYAGLSVLVNDVSCLRMSTYIKDGMVVDIYVEDVITEALIRMTMLVFVMRKLCCQANVLKLQKS